eukprot:g5195.t1
MDTDDSGTIQRSEFKHFCKEMISQMHRMRANLLKAFSAIDVDDSGTIEKEELLEALRDPTKVELLLAGTQALRPLTRPEMYSTLFSALDTDGDHGVTFSEFERFCLHLVMKTSTIAVVLKEVFDSLDDDRSGYLDQEELGAALRSDKIVHTIAHGRCSDVLRPLLMCGHDLQDLFEAMDEDGDGIVTWEEFRDYFVDTALRIHGVVESLRRVFNLIDVRKVGRVTKSELNEALGNEKQIERILETSRDLRPLLDPRHVDSWFELMDVDGDGYIEFDEFKDFALESRDAVDDGVHHHGGAVKMVQLRFLDDEQSRRDRGVPAEDDPMVRRDAQLAKKEADKQSKLNISLAWQALVGSLKLEGVTKDMQKDVRLPKNIVLHGLGENHRVQTLFNGDPQLRELLEPGIIAQLFMGLDSRGLPSDSGGSIRTVGMVNGDESDEDVAPAGAGAGAGSGSDDESPEFAFSEDIGLKDFENFCLQVGPEMATMRPLLLKLFDAIDTDKSSTLELEEILAASRDPLVFRMCIDVVPSLRPFLQPDICNLFFTLMDVDSPHIDGHVGFGQFKQTCLRVALDTMLMRIQLKKIFDRFDEDGSGLVERYELVTRLQQPTAANAGDIDLVARRHFQVPGYVPPAGTAAYDLWLTEGAGADEALARYPQHPLAWLRETDKYLGEILDLHNTKVGGHVTFEEFAEFMISRALRMHAASRIGGAFFQETRQTKYERQIKGGKGGKKDAKFGKRVKFDFRRNEVRIIVEDPVTGAGSVVPFAKATKTTVASVTLKGMHLGHGEDSEAENSAQEDEAKEGKPAGGETNLGGAAQTTAEGSRNSKNDHGSASAEAALSLDATASPGARLEQKAGKNENENDNEKAKSESSAAAAESAQLPDDTTAAVVAPDRSDGSNGAGPASGELTVVAAGPTTLEATPAADSAEERPLSLPKHKPFKPPVEHYPGKSKDLRKLRSNAEELEEQEKHRIAEADEIWKGRYAKKKKKIAGGDDAASADAGVEEEQRGRRQVRKSKLVWTFQKRGWLHDLAKRSPQLYAVLVRWDAQAAIAEAEAQGAVEATAAGLSEVDDLDWIEERELVMEAASEEPVAATKLYGVTAFGADEEDDLDNDTDHNVVPLKVWIREHALKWRVRREDVETLLASFGGDRRKLAVSWATDPEMTRAQAGLTGPAFHPLDTDAAKGNKAAVGGGGSGNDTIVYGPWVRGRIVGYDSQEQTHEVRWIPEQVVETDWIDNHPNEWELIKLGRNPSIEYRFPEIELQTAVRTELLRAASAGVDQIEAVRAALQRVHCLPPPFDEGVTEAAAAAEARLEALREVEEKQWALHDKVLYDALQAVRRKERVHVFERRAAEYAEAAVRMKIRVDFDDTVTFEEREVLEVRSLRLLSQQKELLECADVLRKGRALGALMQRNKVHPPLPMTLQQPRMRRLFTLLQKESVRQDRKREEEAAAKKAERAARREREKAQRELEQEQKKAATEFKVEGGESKDEKAKEVEGKGDEE